MGRLALLDVDAEELLDFDVEEHVLEIAAR